MLCFLFTSSGGDILHGWRSDRVKTMVSLKPDDSSMMVKALPLACTGYTSNLIVWSQVRIIIYSEQLAIVKAAITINKLSLHFSTFYHYASLSYLLSSSLLIVPLPPAHRHNLSHLFACHLHLASFMPQKLVPLIFIQPHTQLLKPLSNMAST